MGQDEWLIKSTQVGGLMPPTFFFGETMKISVIMASYLGYYPNCADKREKRFIFSVNSFLKQTFKDAELVIVSDGCYLTEKIYNEKFKDKNNIKFIKIPKTEAFSGDSRNKGIEIAVGDFLCFLDSDDFFAEYHLERLNNQIIEDMDWAYFDDYSYVAHNLFRKRKTGVLDSKERMVIGSCSIIYKRSIPIKWGSGYGHDHVLIKKLIEKYKFVKFQIPSGYFVCHIPVPGPGFNVDKPTFGIISR